MVRKNAPYQILIGRKWCRLAGFAFILALILQFLPLKTPLVLSLSPSSTFTASSLSRPAESASTAVDLPFSIGPGLVHATEGLTITKIANPSYPGDVDPGENIVYTLIITNNTGDDFDGGAGLIYVTDDIPAYTNYVDQQSPPSWDASYLNQEITWLLSEVFTNNTSVLLTYTVSVSQVTPFGTIISNTNYRINADDIYSDTGSLPITTPVNAPRWDIDKAISFPLTPFVAPGEELEYTLSYSNTGAFDVSGVYTISDVVPEHTTLLTNSLVNAAYSGVDAGSVITWTRSDALSPGDQASLQYRVRVTSPLAKGTEIVNSGYAISGGNVYTAAYGLPVSITVESKPLLEISKHLLNPNIGPGSQATYIIVYTNTGNAAAQNVLITDTLPTSVAFVSSVPNPSYTNTLESGYGWLIANLPVNTPRSITLTAQIDPALSDGSFITNTVTITSPTEGALGDSYTLTTQVFFRPDLGVAISATDAPFFQPTDPITYTVVYTNAGTRAADAVTITLSIPKINVQSIITNGPKLVDTLGDQLIFEHQGQLSPGESGDITILGALVPSPWSPAGETFNAQVTVAAWPEEISGDNNTDSVSREGRPGPPASDFIPAIGAGGVNEAPVNKETTFHIIEIRDVYGNLVYNGTPISFSIGAIGVITPSLPASAQTSNGIVGATINSDQAGPSEISIDFAGSYTKALQVEFIGAALGISKSASPKPVPPGEELVYTIVVSNAAGPNAGDATNVVVTDTLLSSMLIYQSATPTPIVVAPGTYRFELGTISGGDSRTIVINTLIDQNAPDYSTVTNTAIALASEITATVAATDVSDVIIPALEKFVEAETARAGEVVTYSIVYKNKNSGMSITNIRITDTMPAEIVSIVNIDAGDATIIDGDLPELVFNYASLSPSEVATITVAARVAQSPWPAVPQSIENRVTAVSDNNPIPESHTLLSYVTPNVPAQIAFDLPAQAPVGSEIPIQATVRDQYGNRVLNGTAVNFSAAPFGSFNPVTANTSNGVVNTVFTDTKVGTTTITITSDPASAAKQIEFVAPQLEISKSANPDPAAAGNRISYLIELTNTAQLDALGVTIFDDLGAGLIFNAASFPYTIVGGDYVFDLGSLQPGEVSRIAITATAAYTLQAGDRVTNTASVDATGLPSPLSAAAGVDIFTPVLNKFVEPDPVKAGELLTYTIIYRNDSSSTINDILITDTLPARMARLVSTSGASIDDSNFPEIVFSQASLAVASAMTITVVGEMDEIHWPPTLLDFTNHVAAAHAAATTPDTWATTSSGRPGDPYTFTLQAAPERVLVGSSVNVAASMSDLYGNPVLNGTPVSFSVSPFGSVDPTDSVTDNGVAEAVLTANQAGRVTVSADNGAEVITAAVEFVDPNQAFPRLVIVKRDNPDPATPGNNLLYTIRVSNTGDIALTDVTVSDTLDADNLKLTFVESSPPPAAVSGPNYQFDLGYLTPGSAQTVMITVPVKATAGGKVISNTAAAEAAGLDESAITGVITTVVQKLVSDASLRKDVSPDTLRAGGLITYTIVFTNEDSSAATTIRLTDTVPPQVASIVMSDTGGALVEDGSLPQLVFSRATLSAGEVMTITIVGQMQTSPWPVTWTHAINLVQLSTEQLTRTIAATAPFRAGPDVTDKIALQASTHSASVGSSVTITASLTDRYNNPVLDGTALHFSANFGALTPPVTRTTQNGSAAINLSSDQTGLVTVTVTAEGVVTNSVISFMEKVYLPIILK